MGKKDVDEATFAKADHLSQESAIIVTGTVRADERAAGGYELIASAPRGGRTRRTTTRSRRRNTASTT